jgi:hypothetical protein
MRNPLWKIVCYGFSTILLAACTNPGADRPALYAIDSLLNAQAGFLASQKASLTKYMQLADQQETVDLVPQDSMAWRRELEIFTALEIINKPVNRDLYAVDRFADSRSNLTVTAITTTANLPVTYLKIYYQGQRQRVRKIEAEYHESNTLYESARLLTLEFLEVDQVPVLTSYTVVGGQKMFLADSVQYTLNGALKISN